MATSGILCLIALSIFFLWTRKKKNDKPKDSKNKMDDNPGGSKNKIWEKKSFYVYIFVLQFFVLNFIYPGGFFEIKAIYWFFATRNSEEAVVLKKINTILEKDRKQKISLIQEKIKNIEKKGGLSEKDKEELSDLEKNVLNTNTFKPKQIPPPPIPVPTKKMAWVLRLDGSFNRQSSEVVEIDENSLFKVTETEIMFSYHKRGKKHDAWLVRDKAGKFYHGVLGLSDGTKQDLYLLEDGEMFSGYLQQINGNGKSKKALLRKEEIMIKK